MRILGELCLLGAFVGSGFAACACPLGRRRDHPGLRIAGMIAAISSVIALTVVMCVLAWALVRKDFDYAYVAQYSNRLLPWHYSLSALWVGQAGSLLVWAWLTALLALLLWRSSLRSATQVGEAAFAVVMGYVCFLAAIMVFAADPMEPTLSPPQDGAGLSPLLQHPAMLIHPPVVFLGYALWTIPFALATVALLADEMTIEWVRQARPWALAAWTILGAGILLGAQWSYEELGWGGYWSWDPVENGSLIPWLTGTAFIHALMTWQYRGHLKKTTLVLAIATFGLCNFATFLTRSGIFSSLHAFSASPIGWLFLLLLLALGIGGGGLLVRRWRQLRPDHPIPSVLSREAAIVLATIALSLLTVVVFAGTLSMALSKIVLGRFIMVGPAFYNNALVPTGLVLLATTAIAPLLRWGAPPTRVQRQALSAAALAATIVVGFLAMFGVRHWLELLVIGLAVLAAAAIVAALMIDSWKRSPGRLWNGVAQSLRSAHRQYAGFVIHLGFAATAMGIAGSSLGSHEQQFVLAEGQCVTWSGYDARLVRIGQRSEADRLVAEVELEVSRNGRVEATLRPAQHFHLLQQQWTTEVAIHSTWSGDFYTILLGEESDGRARLVLVSNPMMGWLWWGGAVIGLGAVLRLLPLRQRAVRETGLHDSVRYPARRAAVDKLLAASAAAE